MSLAKKLGFLGSPSSKLKATTDTAYTADQWSPALRAGTHTLYKQDMMYKQTMFKLFIDDIDEGSIEMQSILNELQNSTESDTLEVRINSNGGFVHYGMSLLNVMSDNFYERTITLIEQIAASMAGLIFLKGDARLVYPHSTLMIHSTSFGVVGKISEVSDRVIHEKKWNDNNLNLMLKPFFSKKEIEEVISGKDLWIDAEDMCLKGIATGVIYPNGEIVEPEVFLKSVNKGKKKKAKKKPQPKNPPKEEVKTESKDELS